MVLELGILADDLTGGMMVASLLEAEGIRCPLVSSVEALAEIDPDSMSPRQAHEAIYDLQKILEGRR